jgi:transposase
MIDLDSLLPLDHRARVVWRFVETLDLSPLYEAIRAREGEPGRPAADPAVLLALWLFATVEGVGSARELERLTGRDVAYRWLAGGVPVNYHGLSDFRVDHTEMLDTLLRDSVTALIAEGVISLEEIVVDGTKIRANAGRGSFKTAKTLDKVATAVARRLAALKAEVAGEAGADTAASSRRHQAAQERAAREVGERATRARETLRRLEEQRAKRRKTHAKDEAQRTAETSVSLSDPEARRMRFADGAVRAGYNAQIAADAGAGIIVAIEMTDRRNDAGLAGPMVDQIARRYGAVPKRLLVDTNYATAADIAALAEHPTGTVTVFAPPPIEREDVKPETLARRAKQRAAEPDAVRAWRTRMTTPAAATVYRRRKLIERINAECKNHGFGAMLVRGLRKVQAVALWHALAHNLIAAHRLRAQAA